MLPHITNRQPHGSERAFGEGRHTRCRVRFGIGIRTREGLEVRWWDGPSGEIDRSDVWVRRCGLSGGDTRGSEAPSASRLANTGM